MGLPWSTMMLLTIRFPVEVSLRPFDDRSVADFALHQFFGNAAEQVVRDDGVVRVGQTHALPIDVPEEIIIHQVRRLAMPR